LLRVLLTNKKGVHLAFQYTYCFHSLNKALAGDTANIFIKVHKHF